MKCTSLLMLLLTIMACGCGGCAMSSSGSVHSLTGGVMVELYTQRAERAMARYLVGPDGVIRFGGGFDAANVKYSWSGQLTEAEAAELNAILAAHNLFELEPVSTNEPPDVRYDLIVRGPQGKNHIKLEGEHPDIQPLYAFLERVSARRNDAYLQRLPEPSIVEREQ